MSTTGRTDAAARDVDSLAAVLREAPFVRVLSRADGDALAASGVLARALGDAGVPYQVSVAATAPERASRAAGEDADDAVGLVVGDTPGYDGPAIRAADAASVRAGEVARALGSDPDPALVLAGAAAAGVPPGAGETAPVLEAARERNLVDRRPGVATPTDAVAEVAHSTWVHAPFSADEAAARETLGEAADDRTLASRTALSVVGTDGATPRAAEAVERALRPYATPESRFATVGGAADVLDALATAAPGTGVALALGHDARDPALTAWREHADAAHAAVREATTGRYDGLLVARADDAPVRTTARLFRDFRSPEPVALVLGDGEAAAAAVEDRAVDDATTAAAAAVDGAADGRARRGYATFDTDADTKAFIAAFREAL